MRVHDFNKCLFDMIEVFTFDRAYGIKGHIKGDEIVSTEVKAYRKLYGLK